MCLPQSLQQFLEQTWAVMGTNRPQKITLGEMREAGVRHGTGDPALAFLALYRKSSVPYYSNWCSPPSYPVASTGIAKYLAPACRGLFVFPGQVAVLLVALRNGRVVSCIIELVFRPYPACGTTARASAVAAKSCC
jgi:hypothetical protein